MPEKISNRALAVSQKIYGRLLSAYPKAHRKEYGPAMAQLFRDQCRDSWDESRGWGMAKLWLHVLPDLINTSIIEHLSNLNPRKSMSDKMTALFRPLTSPLSAFFAVFTVVFVLVVMTSVVITFIMPESYASTARVKVESSDTPPFSQGIAQSAYDPYFIQTTFEIIQSQIVLDPVIDQLKLNDTWGKKYSNGETLKPSETLKLLKRRISLAPVRNTKLIAITVYSDNRDEAAQIANAIAESYQDYRAKFRSEMTAKGINELQQKTKFRRKKSTKPNPTWIRCASNSKLRATPPPVIHHKNNLIGTSNAICNSCSTLTNCWPAKLKLKNWKHKSPEPG
jgi:capsular polysaccharide biosynthesis protein